VIWRDGVIVSASHMTRVAVVAESEDVRAALAAALRASPAFEVDARAAVADVGGDIELVVVAREPREGSRLRGTVDHEAASAPVLTRREREILALLADGFGNKQIAARLGISTNTVKTHLELLFDKLDVSTRTEAVTAAARRGLLLI
jgi:DNA-binding CsgD family transcriptional regulator